jgi:hypothetical protein
MLLIGHILQVSEPTFLSTESTPGVILKLISRIPFIGKIRQPDALIPLSTLVLHKATKVTIGVGYPDFTATWRVVCATDFAEEIVNLTRAV